MTQMGNDLKHGFWGTTDMLESSVHWPESSMQNLMTLQAASNVHDK